jgi:hypothetical protein
VSRSRVKAVRRVFYTLVLLISGLIHFGTAALRIHSIDGYDFAPYYAGAWSLRMDTTPYPFSRPFLLSLAKTQNLPENIPSLNSPPLWIWLLQPLTALSYPSAAVVWLLMLGLTTICCHILLVEIAGYGGWKIILASLPLTLTFGPVFLNLTLGQNAVVLLLCALIMGEALKDRSTYFKALWIPSWILAVAAKLFPFLWLGCLPYLKRPRSVLLATGICLAAFLGIAWMKPAANTDYWRDYIIGRARRVAQHGAGVDDQSLRAVFNRVATSRHFSIPGLNLNKRTKVDWDLPWEVSSQAVLWISTGTAVLLAVWMLYSWIYSRNRNPDGELYSLILFTMTIVPHMQRYNHLLALPAMAWLWNRGGRGRELVIIAYGLFALSRLNHLWALYLPPVLGSLASGFGLYGVLLLFAGITCYFLMPVRQEAWRA